MSDRLETPAESDADDASRTRDTHSAAAEKATTPAAPFAPYATSWAIVIGINDYGNEQPVLTNARRDAEAMARVLGEDYAFDQVRTLYDAEATHDAILSLLRDELPGQVGAEDRVVIFFAGHGATRESPSGERRGYLVPQDAHRDRYAEYVDMNEVRDACGWLAAKHVLIILDCCFSGVAAITARSQPAPPPKAMTDAYLKRITSRRAWQVLTAGASDDLAADSGMVPGHSAFTGALLAGFRGQADVNDDGLITATELAGFVTPLVSRETGVEGGAGQTPFFNYVAGSQEGDCVFCVPGKVFVPPKPITRPTLENLLPVHSRWFWPAVALAVVLLVVLGVLVVRDRARIREMAAEMTAVAERRETDTHELVQTLSFELSATQRADVIAGQATLRAVEEQATRALMGASGPTRVAAANDLIEQRAEMTRSADEAEATVRAIPIVAAATMDARADATAGIANLVTRVLVATPTPTPTDTPRPKATATPTAQPTQAEANVVPYLKGQALLFVSSRGGSPNLYQLGNIKGEQTLSALVSPRSNLEHGRASISCPQGSLLMHVPDKEGQHHDLYRLDFDVASNGVLALGQPIVLTADQGWDQMEGSWSPDGERIVYGSTVRDTNRLWVMDVKSARHRAITAGSPYRDEQPAWSPDGEQIACVSQVEGEKSWELYILGLDGTRQRVTKLGKTVRAPAWSPDGRWIACAVGDKRTEDIAIVSASARDASLAEMRLFETTLREERPAWSPYGDWIACDREYEDGGKREIVVYEVVWSGASTMASPLVLPLTRAIPTKVNLVPVVASAPKWGREVRLTRNPADDWGPSWMPYEGRCAPWTIR